MLTGLAYHVTQRGVDRRETFSSEGDRAAYLKLVSQNRADARVRLLGWCLMSNHIHLVAIPEREDSLAVLLRRVNGRYAQYYNARTGRSGHLWQNRYFACPLSPTHVWRALIYVERNPVRTGLVECAHECRGEIERCTYAARPYGDESFLRAMPERFGRYWKRGRPKKANRASAGAGGNQASLF